MAGGRASRPATNAANSPMTNAIYLIPSTTDAAAQDIAIFRLESTGALRPEEIVRMAIEVLARKLANIKMALDAEEMEINGGMVVG